MSFASTAGGGGGGAAGSGGEGGGGGGSTRSGETEGEGGEGVLGALPLRLATSSRSTSPSRFATGGGKRVEARKQKGGPFGPPLHLSQSSACFQAARLARDFASF